MSCKESNKYLLCFTDNVRKGSLTEIELTQSLARVSLFKINHIDTLISLQIVSSRNELLIRDFKESTNSEQRIKFHPILRIRFR